jgi:predicted nucleic acid-binding protein
MSWVCPDASVVVRLLTSGSEETPAARSWVDWSEQGHVLAAPALIFYEVANALRRYVASGHLLPEEAEVALDAALCLGIRLHAEPDLHREALRLAARLALPAAYDAHYLAVADKLAAPLYTFDRRLAEKAAGSPIRVHLLPPG